MAAGPKSFGPPRPRVLVTGFGPFPGAPANPTEWLVTTLAADPPAFAGEAELHVEVLPVEYEAVPARLAAFGAGCAPDIAIHFGLSARARGFTLERLARNEVRAKRPDNAGHWRPGGPICQGALDIPSTLPLEMIHRALSAADLPVFWSDDAGGYLCNYLFYLSCAQSAPGFAPAMAGFIHVPMLAGGGQDTAHAMRPNDMLEGARRIITTCIERWREGRAARL